MAKLHDLFSGKGAASQRPLRVGEEIRHALADIFIRGECRAPELFDATITISEVRVAPDMKNATAYFMPLAGQNKEKMLQALKDSAPEIRHHLSRRIKLRHTPRLHFTLDASYDAAQRIDSILKSPKVAKDLGKHGDEDGQKES